MYLNNTTRKVSAAQCLTDLLAEHPTAVRASGVEFQNLLNDFCPELRCERFQLCAVHQIPWFKKRLNLQAVTPNDIFSVETELQNRLGFEPSVAKWISHSWARALKLVIPTDSLILGETVEFSCPHCGCEGQAEPYWSLQVGVCPCCKAHVHFNEMLNVVLIKKGWPKRRLKNRKWTLTSPTAVPPLATQIDRLISTGTLSVGTAAEQIGLARIVSAFQPEVKLILDTIDTERLATGQKHLVHAVLSGFFTDGFIHLFPNIPSGPSVKMMDLFQVDEDQQILGLVTSESSEQFVGLMFTCDSFLYTSPVGTGCIPYSECTEELITYDESILQFKVGANRLVCLRGTGIPRRLIMKVITTLGKCINAAKEHEFHTKH